MKTLFIFITIISTLFLQGCGTSEPVSKTEPINQAEENISSEIDASEEKKQVEEGEFSLTEDQIIELIETDTTVSCYKTNKKNGELIKDKDGGVISQLWSIDGQHKNIVIKSIEESESSISGIMSSDFEGSYYKLEETNDFTFRIDKKDQDVDVKSIDDYVLPYFSPIVDFDIEELYNQNHTIKLFKNSKAETFILSKETVSNIEFFGENRSNDSSYSSKMRLTLTNGDIIQTHSPVWVQYKHNDDIDSSLWWTPKLDDVTFYVD